MNRLLTLALLSFFLALHAMPAQDGGTAARAVLILDASGSMWGKIQGTAKIDIARAAVTQIVEGLDPKVHLGLMAYGHRQRGDCADIELLIPPGPVDKATFIATVKALLPRGRTPITDALIQAAKTLQHTEQKATVILVSDGIETCEQDPCAAVKELKALGIDFTAHVVGFDLDDNEQAAIRCIAETTGGEFLAASDAPSLLTALATAMTKTADPSATAPPVLPAPAPMPEPPAPVPTAEVKEATVTLTTLLAEGGEAVDSYFEVFPEGDTKSVVRGSNKKVKLAPGRYTVKAKWGVVQLSEEATVPAEPESEIILVYNAGILRVKALASEGGEQVKAYYTVSRAGKDLKGQRPRVTASASGEFQLPAGEYHVQAKWGQSVAEAIYEVTPGEITEGDLVANAGVLKLTASPVEGGEQVKAYFTVLAGKAKLNGSREQIAGSATGEFQLGAGTYRVRAKWGEVVGETDVEVKAGELVEAHVLVPGGVLTVKVKDAAGAEVRAFVTLYTAKVGLDGKRQRLTGATSPQFTIPAGAYTLEAKIGPTTVTGEATVKAGEASEVTLQEP
jgi:Ca-activated chloride channel homolog